MIMNETMLKFIALSYVISIFNLILLPIAWLLTVIVYCLGLPWEVLRPDLIRLLFITPVTILCYYLMKSVVMYCDAQNE